MLGGRDGWMMGRMDENEAGGRDGRKENRGKKGSGGEAFGQQNNWMNHFEAN
jgi:hypothetical protein